MSVFERAIGDQDVFRWSFVRIRFEGDIVVANINDTTANDDVAAAAGIDGVGVR